MATPYNCTFHYLTSSFHPLSQFVFTPIPAIFATRHLYFPFAGNISLDPLVPHLSLKPWMDRLCHDYTTLTCRTLFTGTPESLFAAIAIWRCHITTGFSHTHSQGVKHGYPGRSVPPTFFRHATNQPMSAIPLWHEQETSHTAEGYARVSGLPVSPTDQPM
jgi:hypothetical protein